MQFTTTVNSKLNVLKKDYKKWFILQWSRGFYHKHSDLNFKFLWIFKFCWDLNDNGVVAIIQNEAPRLRLISLFPCELHSGGSRLLLTANRSKKKFTNFSTHHLFIVFNFAWNFKSISSEFIGEIIAVPLNFSVHFDTFLAIFPSLR